MRLYTHVVGSTPQDLVADAEAAVADGFTAVRAYPFGDFYNFHPEEERTLDTMSFSSMQNRSVELIGAIRDAVGPDIDVMIDVGNRLTPAEAIGVGQALEPFNLYFFGGPDRAREHGPVGVCCGEHSDADRCRGAPVPPSISSSSC